MMKTTVGGEALDLSLNTTTASAPSSPSPLIPGENNTSLAKKNARFFSSTLPQFCLDQLDSGMANLFPSPQLFLLKPECQLNPSPGQPQPMLPLGALPMPFPWPLPSETAKSKEDSVALPATTNNVMDLSVNAVTTVPTSAFPQPSALPLFLPPLGLPGDGLDMTKKSFNFGLPASSLPVFNGVLPDSFPLSAQIPFSINAQLPFPNLPIATTPPQSLPSIDNSSLFDGQWSSNPSNSFIKKFSSFQECGSQACKLSGNREHFHCTQCEKIFIRREETIRHLKWHKKREESLQYGFMRYSPSDDCEIPGCTHNSKQTHYHCLQPNCAKIYISTSDVQMHANYHKKDAVILQEGFRRYRSTEECDTPNCTFTRERTTHFHCRRPGCNFTFKNKADIEKHKNHHQKNDVFAKDGFRKFTKYEYCKFPGCKNSLVMNHIHCIRPGCDYVVYSSGQILSHKRKHDRRQILPMMHGLSNQAQRVFPKTENGDPHSLYDQNGVSGSPKEFLTPNSSTNWDTTGNEPSPLKREEKEDRMTPSPLAEETKLTQQLIQTCIKITDFCWQKYNNANANQEFSPDISEVDATLVDEVLREVVPSMSLFSGNSCDNEQCSLSSTGVGHFHCYRAGCMDEDKACTDAVLNSGVCDQTTLSVGDLDAWKEHWLIHAWQSTVNSFGFIHCSKESCKPTNSSLESTNHVHCRLWPNCEFSALSHVAKLGNPMLARHWTLHNVHFTSDSLKKTIQSTEPENLDDSGRISHSTSLPRKRGRPPKHSRDIHVPRLEPRPELSYDAIPNLELTRLMFDDAPDNIIGGTKLYPAGAHCIDTRCQYFEGTCDHYHCVRPRCNMATASLFVLNTHRSEFHVRCEIEPGYEYFDRSVDCRRPVCYNKRDTNHFHCVRPRCDYTFVRHSKMVQHTERHNSRSSEELVKLGLEDTNNNQSQQTGPPPPLPPPPQLLPLGSSALNKQPSDLPDLFSLLANLMTQTSNPLSLQYPSALIQQHLQLQQQKMEQQNQQTPQHTTSSNETDGTSTASSPAAMFPEAVAPPLLMPVLPEAMEWNPTSVANQLASSMPLPPTLSAIWNACNL